MTHEEVRELLLDLSYGELEPDLRREVERHVSTCADCESELAALAGTRAAARRLPDPGLPGGRDGLLAAARRAAASRSLGARRSWARPAAWMAVAAAVLAVGGVTFRLLEGNPPRELGPERFVASGSAKVAPPAAPAPAPDPAPAPAESLASREAPARRSREAAPSAAAPVAAADASRAEAPAIASGRSREPAPPADFPAGVSGAFVSIDLRSGASFRVNAPGCATRHSPFSTFKIPGSLIGLETGVVADRSWQQGQDLGTALARSFVPYFRALATRVGEPRMHHWLATFDYGNQDISGGLDHFWLGSSLRVSPDEQAAFLARLQQGGFPVSKASLDLVKEALTQESGPAFRLVAKTGSSDDGEGWLVGWVETREGGCSFALHLVTSSYEEMARLRPWLAREFLRRSGCLPR